MTETNTVTIAAHSDLFVIPASGGGFSCLGFDVCRERTQRLADWLQRADLAPMAPRGTLESYAEYRLALDVAHQRCLARHEQCPAELSPRLVGLEGWRIEVMDIGETKPRRFIVGKSTGWLPCHIELANRTSSYGMAASREYASVRQIEQVR